MSGQTLSPLRRRELAQDKRARHAPQQVFNGLEPRWSTSGLLKRDADRRCDLIAYAAAIGQKRKLLPLDLSRYTASVHDDDGSTAVVMFAAGDVAVHVPVRFLDWSPTGPIAEHDAPPATRAPLPDLPRPIAHCPPHGSPARQLAVRALWTNHPLCELYEAVHGDFAGDGYQPATTFSIKQLIAFAETLPAELVAALASK